MLKAYSRYCPFFIKDTLIFIIFRGTFQISAASVTLCSFFIKYSVMVEGSFHTWNSKMILFSSNMDRHFLLYQTFLFTVSISFQVQSTLISLISTVQVLYPAVLLSAFILFNFFVLFFLHIKISCFSILD